MNEHILFDQGRWTDFLNNLRSGGRCEVPVPKSDQVLQGGCLRHQLKQARSIYIFRVDKDTCSAGITETIDVTR